MDTDESHAKGGQARLAALMAQLKRAEEMRLRAARASATGKKNGVDSGADVARRRTRRGGRFAAGTGSRAAAERERREAADAALGIETHPPADEPPRRDFSPVRLVEDVDSDDDAAVVARGRPMRPGGVRGGRLPAAQHVSEFELHSPRHATLRVAVRASRSLRVTYTSSRRRADRWLSEHALATPTAGPRVFGLDAEWVPYGYAGMPKRPRGGGGPGSAPLSLIQVATENECLLVHLEHMLEPPAMLARLLEDEEAVFVGVGVTQDLQRIHKAWHLPTAAGRVVDIEELPGVQSRSLRKLAEETLGLASWKRRAVTISDWSAYPLAASQMEYAAMDAWVSRAVWDAVTAAPAPSSP